VLRSFRGHDGAVHGVAFLGGAGATRLASAGDDGSLRLWDLATGACTATVSGAHGD
jgi:hypothetical protein